MTLLIVDDDCTMTELLSRTINWKELEIARVLCALSASAARAVFMNESVFGQSLLRKPRSARKNLGNGAPSSLRRSGKRPSAQRRSSYRSGTEKSGGCRPGAWLSDGEAVGISVGGTVVSGGHAGQGLFFLASPRTDQRRSFAGVPFRL